MAESSEQAYWTLLAIIERLLPHSFFSPDLLASRADQLVLADLVEQLVPKVYAHLQELGVDLASVTFGWFLSLFTDCLPVEVGDILLVKALPRSKNSPFSIRLMTVDSVPSLGCVLRRRERCKFDGLENVAHGQTLFRVAIAILKLNEAEILAAETVSDLFTFISGMTSRLWAADKLITVGH